MPRHAPRHLPLPVAVARRHPGLPDPAQAILDGSVLVDGLPVTNPAARVRADAAPISRSPGFARAATTPAGCSSPAGERSEP